VATAELQQDAGHAQRVPTQRIELSCTIVEMTPTGAIADFEPEALMDLLASALDEMVLENPVARRTLVVALAGILIESPEIQDMLVASLAAINEGREEWIRFARKIITVLPDDVLKQAIDETPNVTLEEPGDDPSASHP
jgi:hypothetical protein